MILNNISRHWFSLLSLTLDVIDCLMKATGIKDIKDIVGLAAGGGSVTAYVQGTKALITATTAKQVICAVAKRTAGWGGVAWMVYEFGDCVKSK